MPSDQRALAAVAMATAARLVDLPGFDDARTSRLGETGETPQTPVGYLDAILVAYAAHAHFYRRAVSLSTVAAWANLALLSIWAGSHPSFVLTISQLWSDMAVEYCRLLDRPPAMHDADERGVLISALLNDGAVAGYLDALPHIRDDDLHIMFEAPFAAALIALPDAATWQATMQSPAIAQNLYTGVTLVMQLLGTVVYQMGKRIRSWSARRRGFDLQSFNALQDALNAALGWILASATFPGLYERLPFLRQIAWAARAQSAETEDTVRIMFSRTIIYWFSLLRTVQERISSSSDVNELAGLMELDNQIRPTEIRLIRIIAYEAEGHKIGCSPFFSCLRFLLGDVIRFACDYPVTPPEFTVNDKKALLESFGLMLDNILETWSWPQQHKDRLTATLQALSDVAPPTL